MVRTPVRTRFAPSPTGDLHVGGAWTALASWALTRKHADGRAVLRVEDIDTPRVVRGSTVRILEDLLWLGLDWDEGPIEQSARTAIYEDALAKLTNDGLTYLCDCSRAEIARAASAPHAGEEGRETIYPGTCRDASPTREMKRLPAIRLRVPKDSIINFEDGIHGPVEENVTTSVGDFVLRRGDNVFAYQLVVAIDDAAMELTHVVRADDLLASTARQILLMKLLGYPSIPSYTHVPLVVSPSGERLAKRASGTTIREIQSQKGITPEVLLGILAHGLGLTETNEPRSAREIATSLRPISAWRKTAWRMPQSWQ